MTIGSLFAGIGGLELGLELAGLGPTLWQVESNAYARAVLAKHWPNASREARDVRRAGAHNLAPVDIICGGFPCQDISTAGKGAGLDGKRSGLWSEFARIIRELRPSVVIVENVAALLRRGLDRVLGTLAELGYDAEWSVLSAADVGAPHLRRRLFVIAYLPDTVGFELRNQPITHTRGTSAPKSADDGTSCAVAGQGAHGDRRGQQEQRAPHHHRGDARRYDTGGLRADDLGAWWAAEPDVGRVANGVSRHVDRLRCLGNAVVPACGRVVGERVIEIMNK